MTLSNGAPDGSSTVLNGKHDTGDSDVGRVITPEQVEQFYDQGSVEALSRHVRGTDDIDTQITTPLRSPSFNSYLIIPNFFSSSTAKSLLSRSQSLISGFDLSSHPLTRFATGEKDHIGDDYFLTSGDKIRFFFEQDAFDEHGNLTRPKEQSINKVGHALHELDEEFRAFSLDNQRLKTLARELHYHNNPKVLQSMVICKQPQIGELSDVNSARKLMLDAICRR